MPSQRKPNIAPGMTPACQSVDRITDHAYPAIPPARLQINKNTAGFLGQTIVKAPLIEKAIAHAPEAASKPPRLKSGSQ
ncbi:MAG: hypothetical protein OSA92_08225 [Pirellulaceae bacterium]|nr:hypothetical protein [Pirellulaceae bacterium]